MGSRWGINRTVGQVYALLYISPQPLCADEIVEALGISRSNVSMSLKELQAWNLAILKHFPVTGAIFSRRLMMSGRFCARSPRSGKREIDPTLSVLREILMETPENEDERHAQRRIDEMKTLIEQLTGWYDDVKRLETERLASLLALGSKVTKLLEAKDKIVSLARPRGTKKKG